MKPYYSDAQVTIYHGDCRDVLPAIDPCDTCVTDPPYGLAFMGKAWDHAVPDAEYWRAVRGAVKPGASLMAFGGTRLWHWLAVGIEEAGWEIRDTLMWMYGSGFPKSLDISKALDKAAGAEREDLGPSPNWRDAKRENGQSAGHFANPSRLTAPATDAAHEWQGWGTALKPAWEPIILAMRPLDGTFAENAVKHGVAGLNVDGGRVGTGERVYIESLGNRDPDRCYGKGLHGSKNAGTTTEGRWPANVLLDEEAARMLDEQSGVLTSGEPGVRRSMGFQGHASPPSVRQTGPGDSGGASRFFYTAKASRSERGEFNDHPTVKPLDLMAYLCRLTATPAGGTVLDPFMGSGSTLIAANRTGRKAVGIEKDEASCEIAAKRIMAENPDLFAGGAA